MKGFLFALIFGAILRPSNLAAPDTALNCCEGDVLLLLDSSGSVSSYEFSRLLCFLVDLLRPFSLGRGHVRVGLLQVDTKPHLEFGLDAHSSQPELKAALLQARQLSGDTNTVSALSLARDHLSGAGEHAELPKVLLWLTDGVLPGDVDRLMSELKGDGVAVLALAIGQGNYQTLRRAVTPPIESHLYVVNIDDISIVMEDLREAIIEIIRAERLRLVHLSARSAVLQWRRVLTTHTGYYRLQWQCLGPGAGSISTTGCGATAGHSRSVSGDSSRAELSDLRPDTTYTASLTPESHHNILFSTLSVTFTTLPACHPYPLCTSTILQMGNRVMDTCPPGALNCCERDILLLLDSSGSVSSYEFSRLLCFLVDLLRPFSLGRGHVRVGLLQVDTEPRLEFGLGAHGSQPELKAALLQARQLSGDTNTVSALSLARDHLSEAGEHAELPKVLLWLTDGVLPGDVDRLMSELKGDGVAVLALAIGQGNYQTLRRAVTPPIESNLYVVDIDYICIVMEDLREAIIEIISADRLRVVNLSPRSAVLQWRPVLTTQTGYYRLQCQCVGPGTGSISTTGCGDTAGRPHSRSISGDSSWAELSDLQPDASYTASLTPVSNHDVLFSTLSVTFTTLPELLGPAVVSVLDSGPHQIHVSWGPLQPERVQGYRVEYAALPSGHVRTVTVNGHQSSAVLAELEPDTQYLVTVIALYSAGAEKAMSVKACTREVAAPLPALKELLLTPLDGAGVEVKWRAHSGQDTLRGYWLSWEVETSSGPSTSVSSMTVNAGTVSAQLAHVSAATGGRVCVSPIYSAGRGDGLCCSVGGN